jgi:hypothetical protein
MEQDWRDGGSSSVACLRSSLRGVRKGHGSANWPGAVSSDRESDVSRNTATRYVESVFRFRLIEA